MSEINVNWNKVFVALENVSNPNIGRAVDRATNLVAEEARTNIRGGAYHPTGELEGSIRTNVEKTSNTEAVGRVMTDNDHAWFVEFGTGRKGVNSPGGEYTVNPHDWFVHESQADLAKYGMKPLTLKNGEKFYHMSGASPMPYMYPALRDNVDKCIGIMAEELSKDIFG